MSRNHDPCKQAERDIAATLAQKAASAGLPHLCGTPEQTQCAEIIRAELLEDGALSDEGAALAALLHKSGVIGRYFSDYEKKALKERLKELKDRPDNQLVGRMIEYIEDLMALAVVAST